jgi:hypothetical protein
MFCPLLPHCRTPPGFFGRWLFWPRHVRIRTSKHTATKTPRQEARPPRGPCSEALQCATGFACVGPRRIERLIADPGIVGTEKRAGGALTLLSVRGILWRDSDSPFLPEISKGRSNDDHRCTTTYWGYPCCGSASANVYGHRGNAVYAGTRSWYASADGNAYRNADGGWQQHSASGWQSASGDTSWADREQQPAAASRAVAGTAAAGAAQAMTSHLRSGRESSAGNRALPCRYANRVAPLRT